MVKTALIALALIVATTAALAQFSPCQMGFYGFCSGGGAAGPPPVGCGTGAINLSTGCTQAMLGGL